MAKPIEIIEPEWPEIVIVTKKEYDHLKEIERQYNHLIELGVDNWEHYSILSEEETQP